MVYNVILFCLLQNVNYLTRFVVERQLKHGDGRYIFVTFLNNGSPYNSRYFIRDNDRFRLHYLFMIKYDGYGWSVASFYDPFTRRERPYTAGQDVEQVFSDQLRNVHGYHFSLEYGRLTFGSAEQYTQYEYFIKTVARARGGKATLLPSFYEKKYFPDFMIIEDLYFDTTRLAYIKLLPMNQFRYLCAVTPVLDREIPWLHVFIDPFHWTVWVTFLVVVEMLVLFIYLFGYRGSIRRSLLTVHFEIFQTFINGPSVRRRTQLEEFIIGMFVLLCMILLAVYESALVSSMSLKRFYPEIDTIDEVNNSKYPVVVVKHVTEQFNLRFRHTLFLDEDDRFRHFSLYNKTDYQHVIPCEEVHSFLDRDEKGRMHKVAQHLAGKTNNFAIARFSPYGEMLYYYWNAFVEADLLKYWQLKRFAPKYFDRSGDFGVRPIALRDMNIAWFVILFGCTGSWISYIVEVVFVFSYRKCIIKK